MRKVLVVGLGGSGAKTLSLMMDELLADLKSNYDWDEERLPDCWKFVSIDVPLVAASLGGKLTLPIDRKGGQYLGLAQDAATPYSVYAQVAHRKFGQAHDPSNGDYGLQEYARWHPSDEFGNGIAVGAGAGAHRAIGRILTLANSERIYAFLKQNVLELMKSDLSGEKLAQTLNTAWHAKQSPLILLVGSLAGGSGASMLLDVADLLNGLSAEVQDFRGDESFAFVYTPEIFSSIEPVATAGGGIALAAISEILNARAMGPAPWSNSRVNWKSLLPTLGVPAATVSFGRGPYLTYPIGASTGGVPFGNTPEDVYRGFARVLTPLLSDDIQQDAFYEYSTTNYKSQMSGKAKDHTKLASRVRGGAAELEITPVFFGGFGSSKLGTGRSRYREYSAQRIARRAVEILVNGFSDPVMPEGAPAVLKARAAENFTAQFFQVSNIDGRRSGETNFVLANVLESVLKNRSNIEALAIDQISRIAPVLQGETAGELGVRGFINNWSAEEGNRLEVAKQVASEALLEWTDRVLADIEKAYAAALSVYGIDVAELLLNNLSRSLTQLHGSLPEQAMFESGPRETVNRFLSSMRSQARVNWGQHRTNLDKALTNVIEGLVKNKVAELLKEILPELANQVLEQLKRSGKELYAELQSELNEIPEAISTAAYREAPVNQWPKTDHVPAYFEPAVNEVLLTTTDVFATTFREHLALETGKDPAQFEAALKEAAQQVILRAHLPKGAEAMTFFTTWDHLVLSDKTHPHVERTNEWKPGRISNPPTIPTFRLQLGTADLLSNANKWIGVNKSSFDQYCRTSLSAWVAQSNGNEGMLASLLAKAINFAKPLVTVDVEAARFFHDPTVNTDLEFIFSKLPFASNSTSVTQMVSGKSKQFSDALLDACDPAADRTEISIFSRFTGFYYPWAMESLTAPIRNAYETLRNRGTVKSFWKLQRSRTLSQALPIGQDVIDAMLRGYFIGRITGRLMVQKDTASIFVQPDLSAPGRWVEFSKELLGGKELNLALGGDATDKLNIPVVLLESLPLALVKVYGQSHESLTPYLELFRLGKNLKWNGYGVRSESKTELDEWFVGTSDFDPLTKAEPRTDERKAEAERILRKWAAEADAYWTKAPRESQNYEWQIFGELAPNISRACNELVEELNRSEPKLGEFTSSEERFVAQVLEEPMSDEEDIY